MTSQAVIARLRTMFPILQVLEEREGDMREMRKNATCVGNMRGGHRGQTDNVTPDIQDDA